MPDNDNIHASAVISAANTYEFKFAIDMLDNSVSKRRPSAYKPKTEKKNQKTETSQCVDKAYNSKQVEQELMKRGCMYCKLFITKKSFSFCILIYKRIILGLALCFILLLLLLLSTVKVERPQSFTYSINNAVNYHVINTFY